MAEARADSSLGGYDDDFVDVVDDELHCPICQLPLKEAVQTGVCGHRFCRQCLGRHFMRQEKDRQQLSCPVDRNNLVREEVYPPQVYPPHRRRLHLQTALLWDIFPDKATQRKILSFVIKCPSEGCQWTGELRSKDDHLASCPLKLVSCTNQNCHVSIARKDLQEHVTTTCQWRIIPCTYCDIPHPACETEAHQQECKKYPLHCPNSCGAVIMREEISSHLEKDCMLTVISCPYAQMGCTQKFQRREVEVHLESGTRLHLDLACVKLNETESKLIEAREEFRNTQEKFEETKRKHEEKISNLENILLYYQKEHTWKISGIMQKLTQIKAGEKVKMDSVPFYTGAFSRCGYKFKISSTLERPSDFQQTSLSVYFVIMKGEYDSILPWPFCRKVNFTLSSEVGHFHEGKYIIGSINIVESITPDPTKDEDWNKRPVTDENTGKCFGCFVIPRMVYQRRRLSNDPLFFQLRVVLSEA